MEDKDIQIGRCYDLKVGKNVTPVRIMKPYPMGGWETLTLASEKTIIIKSAKRILGPHNPKAGKKPPKSPAPAKEKPLSALDAAAKVLAEINEALSCKQLIEHMTYQGYWKPDSGKTPANTLHAAISTEIKKKGDQARFEKVGRGQFALRPTA